ncbi:uncharacterized protein MONBRDRAFT_3591, partial [Monosiga brevicollis MX1]
NDMCADCGTPHPSWASLNHGVLICIKCSGVHRNLGVHVSRVRSIELDDWSEEQLQLMYESGNALVNSVYEARPEHAKPSPDSDPALIKEWIEQKY